MERVDYGRHWSYEWAASLVLLCIRIRIRIRAREPGTEGTAERFGHGERRCPFVRPDAKQNRAYQAENQVD